MDTSIGQISGKHQKPSAPKILYTHTHTHTRAHIHIYIDGSISEQNMKFILW